MCCALCHDGSRSILFVRQSSQYFPFQPGKTSLCPRPLSHGTEFSSFFSVWWSVTVRPISWCVYSWVFKKERKGDFAYLKCCEAVPCKEKKIIKNGICTCLLYSFTSHWHTIIICACTGFIIDKNIVKQLLHAGISRKIIWTIILIIARIPAYRLCTVSYIYLKIRLID